MRIGSLFSGAGALDMAVESAFGGETVWHCELDSAASKVLAARWPDVPNLGDITAVDWAAIEPVDILCGGFPCQDVSSAGRRAGMSAGTRSGLWAIFADAIAALRPSIVVIENVRGLLSAAANRPVESADATVGDGPGRPVLRAAGAVLGDLADLGYDAQWATVAAADIGAPHRRERVFIVAYAQHARPRREADNARWRQSDAAGRDLRVQSDGRGAAVAHSTRDGRHEGRPESARLVGGSDAAISGAGSIELLPTPSAAKAGNDIGLTCSGDGRDTPNKLGWAVSELLSTPQARDYKGVPADGFNTANLCRDIRNMGTDWGKYEPAIRRWESLTRPAPAPTEPNTKGNPRLSAALSEWLMGWPAGWVTDVEGISRNDALRIIGNGVVPQQAAAALQWLLSVSEMAA